MNFIISNSGESINHIRKLIVSNQNSKSVFIEEFISLNSIENFSTSVTEIIQEKNSEISEDELKKSSNEVQKITDNYIKKIDIILESKTNDILKV